MVRLQGRARGTSATYGTQEDGPEERAQHMDSRTTGPRSERNIVVPRGLPPRDEPQRVVFWEDESPVQNTYTATTSSGASFQGCSTSEGLKPNSVAICSASFASFANTVVAPDVCEWQLSARGHHSLIAFRSEPFLKSECPLSRSGSVDVRVHDPYAGFRSLSEHILPRFILGGDFLDGFRGGRTLVESRHHLAQPFLDACELVVVGSAYALEIAANARDVAFQVLSFAVQRIPSRPCLDCPLAELLLTLIQPRRVSISATRGSIGAVGFLSNFARSSSNTERTAALNPTHPRALRMAAITSAKYAYRVTSRTATRSAAAPSTRSENFFLSSWTSLFEVRTTCSFVARSVLRR